MLEALYEIGKVQETGDFLEEFIDDIGGKYKHLLLIEFEILDSGEIAYTNIRYEEYDPSKKLNYFYKQGGSNGPDKTPISRITNLEKTYNKKILSSVKQIQQ